MNLIHIWCLARWIKSRPQNVPPQYCDLCHHAYSSGVQELIQNLASSEDLFENCPLTMKKALTETLANISVIQRRLRTFQ